MTTWAMTIAGGLIGGLCTVGVVMLISQFQERQNEREEQDRRAQEMADRKGPSA